MTRVYYGGAVGCALVFDISRKGTLEAARKWKRDIDEKVLLPNDEPIPVVLLANKCDLPKDDWVIDDDSMDSYCKEEGYIGWFKTSAKANEGITEAFRFLVTNVLRSDVEQTKDGDAFRLGGTSSQKKMADDEECAC
eukprot:TRINITY_DN222_c0_g2_i3.p1 TRINITY_DN222_c0_g2~~TRINITY_DN222_c0_g2_i3.p1  ORF type:complete len:137 (-),score=33.19 TRINITY_DN222_c0_g2_i3:51-461(-)